MDSHTGTSILLESEHGNKNISNVKKDEIEAKLKELELKVGGNRGEKDEVLVGQKLYHYSQSENIDELVKIFGEEASQGIELMDVNTTHPIANINQIKKAKSSCKADISILMKKTQKVYNASVKSKNASNPSIVNATRRSLFIKNRDLSKYVPSMDILMPQYLADPDNQCGTKSEVDRNLSSYGLSEKEKDDVAAVISYFMFEGTGKGTSSCKANAVIEYSGDEISFNAYDTEAQRLGYVLKNWNRYIISVRGLKKQKSGKIRGNGILKRGLSEDDEAWGCYYTKDGVKYPRGAICIRMKTK